MGKYLGLCQPNRPVNPHILIFCPFTASDPKENTQRHSYAIYCMVIPVRQPTETK